MNETGKRVLSIYRDWNETGRGKLRQAGRELVEFIGTDVYRLIAALSLAAVEDVVDGPEKAGKLRALGVRAISAFVAQQEAA